MSTGQQSILQSTEELYDDLLREHEKALQKISILKTQLGELQDELDIPKEMMAYIEIKGDTYIKTRLIDMSSICATNGGILIKLDNMMSTFIWSSLKKYKEQLPTLYFKQISKSCIINTMLIYRIINQTVEMKNGDKFEISESYKKTL